MLGREGGGRDRGFQPSSIAEVRAKINQGVVPMPIGKRPHPSKTDEDESGRGSETGSNNSNKRVKTDGVGKTFTSFHQDAEGFVEVYTDGACPSNGKKGACAGIGVWFGDDHDLNISEPAIGRQTNNVAEIQAVERAISQAKRAGIKKLSVFTDSQFTIKCVTEWMPNWKKRNWRLASGGDVKNREDLEKLDAVMKGIELKWNHVRGHQGIYGNEQADKLAVAGAHKNN